MQTFKNILILRVNTKERKENRTPFFHRVKSIARFVVSTAAARWFLFDFDFNFDLMFINNKLVDQRTIVF